LFLFFPPESAAAEPFIDLTEDSSRKHKSRHRDRDREKHKSKKEKKVSVSSCVRV